MEVYQERNSWLFTLAQFGAWIISTIGAIADILYIRDMVDTIFTVVQSTHNQNFTRTGGIGVDLTFGYALTAYDEFIFFGLGLVAIAAIVAIEYYFRKGRPKGLLFKRIGIVFGIELGIIVVSILTRTLV